MSQHLIIGALIVAYQDKEAVVRILHSLRKQTRKLDYILIVDNSPSSLNLDDTIPTQNIPVEKVDYPENVGLSGAFLFAQKWANQRRIHWLWMFDQDSVPEPTSLEKLINFLGVVSHSSQHVGMLACGVYNRNGEKLVNGYKWRRYKYIESEEREDCLPYSCDAVISSGSMVNLEKVNQAELIEKKLFIDFVDFDLCRKIIAKGFSIYVVPAARMSHELGQRVLVEIPYLIEPVEYFHLSPVRVFHICRNQSFVEYRNSKFIYWPVVAFNRVRHSFYFIQGAFFSKTFNYRTIAAALLGLTFGCMGPSLWPEKLFRR